MGLLDSLFGNKTEEPQNQYAAPATPARPQNADEQALARYRYMLQTAPPEELEKAHEEAFARLTPEQRQMALKQMSEAVPEAEARGLTEDPRSLARAATRAEMRQPGTMDRMFGGGNAMGGGMMGGMGGMLAGSLLSSIAGSFIGSSIAHSFFSNPGMEQAFQGSPEAQSVDGGVADYDPTNYQETGLDSSADPYGDPEANVQDASADNNTGDLGDTGGFDDTSFDGGGFDGGGFDGGDFGGDF